MRFPQFRQFEKLSNAFHLQLFHAGHQSGRLHPIPRHQQFREDNQCLPGTHFAILLQILLLKERLVQAKEFPFHPGGARRGRLRRSFEVDHSNQIIHGHLPALTPSHQGRVFDDRENFRVICPRELTPLFIRSKRLLPSLSRDGAIRKGLGSLRSHRTD